MREFRFILGITYVLLLALLVLSFFIAVLVSPPAVYADTVIATVAVGSYPGDVAVNKTTNKIYVANGSSNNLTVINGADNSTTTIALGAYPMMIAINEATNMIYALTGSNSVKVVNGATNTVTATVSTGNDPRTIAVNSTTNKIYVTNCNSGGAGSVTRINGADNTTTTISTANAAMGLGINETTNKIYVSNYNAYVITVINGATDSVETTIATTYWGIDDIVVNPTTNKIYVCNFNGSTLIAINGADNTSTNIALGEVYPACPAVNKTTNRIYVVCQNSSYPVKVVDGATNSLLATVNIGSYVGDCAVNETTNKIYMPRDTGYVYVMDGTDNTTTSVAVGTSPYNLAVNPSTNRTYVTNSGSNNCSVLQGIATTHPITASAGSNGSISPSGAVTVNNGSNQAFTITPAAHYHVADVLVDSVSVGAVSSYTFTNVTTDHTIVASFTIDTYTLTYTAGANGSITGTTPQTVNHGASGTEVTAVAATNYHFVNWSDASTANPRTDTNVTANITVTANFAIDTYTVTPSAGAGGSISPNTPQTMSHGSTTSFTITPDNGYTASVGGTCGGTLVDNTYTTNAITGNCTVAATFTLSCSCIFVGTISPTNISYTTAGGSGTVMVSEAGCCCWGARSNASWITVTSGANGCGYENVTYTAAENPGLARTGTITIAWQTFTISQDSGCSFTISPASASYSSSGGTGSITVTASESACTWTAVSNASWITITAGASGTGSGTVGYSASENTGSARSGTMTIAGSTFTVNQSSGCTYSINPTSASYGASGGSGSVTITASDSACTWMAVSNASWITITSGSSGTDSGTVEYSVAENTGSARSGTMTIAGNTFTVNQSSGCAYSMTPESATYSSSGGTGSVNVTASDSGCTWTATISDPWIIITSGESGAGSGTVSYAVEENTDLSARTGEITIADQTHSVIQGGRSVSFDDVIGMYNDYLQGLCTWDEVIATYLTYLAAEMEGEQHIPL